jgi:glycosyltransferase involved in cell wall biosynthesis
VTRVVYVVDNISFRGGERTFLQLVSGLPRSRYDVAVACSPGGVFVERLHDLGVPVIAAEMRQRRRFDTVLGLAREFRRRRPQIVHTQGRGDPFGRMAARLARVPGLVSTTAAIVARYEVQERWRRLLYRSIDRVTDPLVDRFIVVNRASVNALTQRHRIPASRIAVIPNGHTLFRTVPS